MKVELHLHTSRYSLCARASAELMLSHAALSGYQAVFITEHHTIWPPHNLRTLQQQFPHLRVFGGVELTLEEPTFQHLLVLGASDPEYLAIQDPAEVLAKARADELPTILAHPFRWRGGDHMLAAGLLPDAIEFRTPNHDAEQGRRSQQAADELGVAIVNTGDAHNLNFLDRFWIETDEPVDNPSHLRQIIRAGRYANCSRATGENKIITCS